MLQVAGFAVGCALVAWCVARALRDGGDGLEKLRAAPLELVIALLLATVASIACSGLTFWALVRPIRPLSAIEMQAVNLMASLFNYAPVRLGLVLRCAFHWKVERIPATDLAAWLAGVAAVTLATLSAGLAAGFVQLPLGRAEPRLDVVFLASYLLVCGAAATGLAFAGRLPILRRLLRGGERVVTSPSALALGVLFRTVDLAAWGARMWAAARIVGVEIGPAQAVLLAAVAILGASNPLGRIGWREWLVTVTAPLVLGGTAEPDQLEVLTAQLALLESASEAAVTIPLGVLGTIWCVRALRRVPSTT